MEKTEGMFRGEELEPMSHVWQLLPEELQAKIAEEHLPALSILRLRCVSRSWSKTRLRLGATAMSGFHIFKKRTRGGRREIYSLCSRKKQNLRILNPASRLPSAAVACVNGLLAIVVHPLVHRPHEVRPLHFELCNIFTPGSISWTRLHPPPTLDLTRDCLFQDMSSLPGSSRVSDASATRELDDDFLLLAALPNHDDGLDRATNVLFQVYRGGVWSNSLFYFPDGYSLMYSASPGVRSGVLRGSVFYFLLMRLDFSSASLACIDFLTPDKRCKFLCDLDPGVVTEWEISALNVEHPKLAVCSGKLVLAHQRVVAARGDGVFEYTTDIQVLDEEKMRWSYVSSLPEELREGKSFSPHETNHGGDELLMWSKWRRTHTGFVFNLRTGAWSAGPRDPAAPADQCPQIIAPAELLPLSIDC